jgi:type I restriction enzyme M protein
MAISHWTNPDAKNKFCQVKNLGNESSVEQFFLIRLIKDLGFRDEDIKTKESLDELVISAGGRKKENYKPDYVLYVQGKPRIVVEAKGVGEDIDDFVYQASGYALALNRKFKGEKPVKFCLLSNGEITKLFPWDEDEELTNLGFTDFTDDNLKFQRLQSYISTLAIKKAIASGKEIEYFSFKKPEIKEIIGVFRACHTTIRSAEKSSPSFAFYEFAKLMFIKINEDRKLRQNPDIVSRLEAGEPIPKDKVIFSTHWIEKEEATTGNANPVETLFGLLREELEDQITKKEKKRIFDKSEHLRLEPSTIKEIVKLLEHRDLFGIDEDLNGRLFETFLGATMRGKDLGQFFTPRSVVKFMTKLADLQVNKEEMDRVIDACCGTGGFLIEAMAEMSNKIKKKEVWTSVEKAKCLERLRKDYLFGIDAGKDPPIARIARINMYLHGDGGSRVYFTDSLDKKLTVDPNLADIELKRDREELRNKLIKEALRFDVVLTNPPFAMRYSKTKPNEKEILEQYRLAYQDKMGSRDLKNALRSSIMFLERYSELLKPHGKFLTLIDESILNTDSNKQIRDFIRNQFIIKAVISLPKNTFVNADTGVKTSILYLVKKENPEESQPKVFMAISQNVGHGDSGKETPEQSDLNIILEAFRKFEKGELTE